MIQRKIVSQLQHGMALIMLVFIIGLAFTAWMLYAMDANQIKIEHDKRTAFALSEAKAALLGYASSYKRPGAFPCPDTNNDGSANPNGDISCFSNIGRLPWKTLGLDDIRDGNGERLWYVVSANFANVPSAALINSDNTKGTLFVCSENGCGDPSPVPLNPLTPPLPILSQLVAIVFSPGPPLAGQSRQDGVDVNPNPAANIDDAKKPQNYLDTIVAGANQFNNATGSNNGNDFITGKITGTFNDRLLAISSTELFGNIDKRMQATTTLQEIAACLIEYSQNNSTVNDKRLPWPAPVILGDYNADLSFDDDVTKYTGRMPYKIESSTSAVPVHNWDSGAASKKQKMKYCAEWPDWWSSWKNDVFYAVSKDFAPDAISIPQVCAGNCVTVDGIGPYAAILIFSGKKLAGQVRETDLEKANPENFLESGNAVEVANNTGKGDFTKLNVNDVLVCIRQNMTIDATCAAP